MQMTENVLNYNVHMNGTSTTYIDLFHGLSAVNRKLIRQQNLLTVLQVNAYSASSDHVLIAGAPRNYVTRNAMVKIFSLWKAQQKLAYDAVGGDGIKPKWQDFKVYLNNAHRVDILAGTNPMPVGGDWLSSTGVDEGEWIHSKIVYESADPVPGTGLITEYDPELHIMGDDNGNTNVGIIHQYAISRRLPFAPDPEIPGNIEHSQSSA